MDFNLVDRATRVYLQPDFDSITVEVRLDRLDKELAFAEAKKTMDTTFSLINQINPQATAAWSTAKGLMIDSALKKRREEVIKAYTLKKLTLAINKKPRITPGFLILLIAKLKIYQRRQ